MKILEIIFNDRDISKYLYLGDNCIVDSDDIEILIRSDIGFSLVNKFNKYIIMEYEERQNEPSKYLLFQNEDFALKALYVLGKNLCVPPEERVDNKNRRSMSYRKYVKYGKKIDKIIAALENASEANCSNLMTEFLDKDYAYSIYEMRPATIVLCKDEKGYSVNYVTEFEDVCVIMEFDDDWRWAIGVFYNFSVEYRWFCESLYPSIQSFVSSPEECELLKIIFFQEHIKEIRFNNGDIITGRELTKYIEEKANELHSA